MIAPNDWEPQIKRLRLLSIEMLELAQAQGWDEVTVWENKRRALLDDLFQSTPPADVAPLLEDTIQTVLASDARLLDLARGKMNELGDLLKMIRLSRRAHHAYHAL
jgi:hypothetical protein